jgi:predicted nucleic acid-binding protein
MDTVFFRLSSKNIRFAISAITCYEIFVGETKENVFWNSLLSSIDILYFDLQCANKAADVMKSLKRRNQIIDTPDLFIAATALSHNLSIATLNKKHFERIEGLDII